MNTVKLLNGAVAYERLKTLSAFIRSQANLTDSRHPVIGPGSVTLNHEESLLCADALDTVIGKMKQEISGREHV